MLKLVKMNYDKEKDIEYSVVVLNEINNLFLGNRIFYSDTLEGLAVELYRYLITEGESSKDLFFDSECTTKIDLKNEFDYIYGLDIQKYS